MYLKVLLAGKAWPNSKFYCRPLFPCVPTSLCLGAGRGGWKGQGLVCVCPGHPAGEWRRGYSLTLENNQFSSTCPTFGDMEGFCDKTWSHSLFPFWHPWALSGTLGVYPPVCKDCLLRYLIAKEVVLQPSLILRVRLLAWQHLQSKQCKIKPQLIKPRAQMEWKVSKRAAQM